MKKTLIAVAVITAWSQSAIAEGDVAAGEKVFKKCAACHAVDEGRQRVGPTMFGVWGRQVGAVEGYNYSSAMQDADFAWNEEQMRGFLAAPKRYLLGTKMSFPGLKNEREMTDIIAYLKTLN